MGCSDNFRKLNFELSEYRVDGNNKSYKEYIITRDGFVFLVMGYTGEKNCGVKERLLPLLQIPICRRSTRASWRTEEKLTPSFSANVLSHAGMVRFLRTALLPYLSA